MDVILHSISCVSTILLLILDKSHRPSVVRDNNSPCSIVTEQIKFILFRSVTSDEKTITNKKKTESPTACK